MWSRRSCGPGRRPRVTPQPWFENVVGAGQTATLAVRAERRLHRREPEQHLAGAEQHQGRCRPSVADQPADSDAVDARRRRRFVLPGLVRDGAEADDPGHDVYRRTTRCRSRKTRSASRRIRPPRSRRHSTPDVDYGPAQFDRRHVLNSNFVYDLPFGRDSTGLKNRLISDWYLAGIVTATSGVPLDVCQRAGAYGGGLTFVTCSGALLNGAAPDSGVFGGVAGSGGVGTSGDPAAGGTGLNMFARPAGCVSRVPVHPAGSGRPRRPRNAARSVALEPRHVDRQEDRHHGKRSRRCHCRDPEPVQHHAVQQRFPQFRDTRNLWRHHRAGKYAEANSAGVQGGVLEGESCARH